MFVYPSLSKQILYIKESIECDLIPRHFDFVKFISLKRLQVFCSCSIQSRPKMAEITKTYISNAYSKEIAVRVTSNAENLTSKQSSEKFGIGIGEFSGNLGKI